MDRVPGQAGSAGGRARSPSSYLQLSMKPIDDEFRVWPTAVGVVFAITVRMCHLDAVACSWLPNPVAHRARLMIFVLWNSIRRFIARFRPRVWLLLWFGAPLGIGIGAEWPAGTALPTESGPPAHADS